MAKRRKLSKQVEVLVLTQSRRRCALCFGLEGDVRVKRGQIAHLDRDSSNNQVANLAFLCQPHHDEYDSRPSQTKGLQEGEVKQYRDDLLRLASSLPLAVARRGSPGRGKAKAVSPEVFDRRIVVYRLVREFIMSIISSGKVDLELVRKFGADTEEALFVFDQEVASHIDSLYRRALELRALQSQLRMVEKAEIFPPSAEALLEKESGSFLWFTDQLTVTRAVFKTYLHL